MTYLELLDALLDVQKSTPAALDEQVEAVLSTEDVTFLDLVVSVKHGTMSFVPRFDPV